MHSCSSIPVLALSSGTLELDLTMTILQIQGQKQEDNSLID